MESMHGKVACCLAAGVALAAACSTGRSSMERGKNVLFSKVEGRIVFGGEPVKDAKVTQITLWKSEGEVGPVTTSSDESGRFAFEEINRKSGFSSLLPGQITIVQRLEIEHGGKEYVGWINTKSSFERHGENGGKPLVLVCDLGHTPTNQGDDFGVCKPVDR